MSNCLNLHQEKNGFKTEAVGVEGDADKQARSDYWSSFAHSWARIKSKTIFGIGILVPTGWASRFFGYFSSVHRGGHNRLAIVMESLQGQTSHAIYFRMKCFPCYIFSYEIFPMLYIFIY